MIPTFSIGYANFTVFLMLLTGGLILKLDVKRYESSGMNKEKKAARYLGWLNIFAGLGTYVVNWVYQNLLV